MSYSSRKTSWEATLVLQEQEAATIKVIRRILKKKTRTNLMSLDFCCVIKMVDYNLGVNNIKLWIHSVSMVQSDGSGGVV